MTELKAALKSQYHASLKMMRLCIRRCPEELWLEGKHPRSYWRIVYHALYYSHWYLLADEKAMVPWVGHEASMPALWGDPPVVAALSQKDAMKYLKWLDFRVDDMVDALDLSSPTSGFSWYPISKLEHQLVNVRHLQGHVGQLSELLMARGIEVDWVSAQHPNKGKSPEP